jgi:tetratricopeptide (TPR) repeat protein
VRTGGWRGRLESAPVQFTLAAPADRTEEAQFLREQARFASDQGDMQTARSRARQAVQKADDDKEAWLILGNANARLGSCAEAIAAFETYLDLCRVPRSYPPPKPQPGTTKDELYHAYFGGPKEQRNPEHEAIRRRIYLLRGQLRRELQNAGRQ